MKSFFYNSTNFIKVVGRSFKRDNDTVGDVSYVGELFFGVFSGVVFYLGYYFFFGWVLEPFLIAYGF